MQMVFPEFGAMEPTAHHGVLRIASCPNQLVSLHIFQEAPPFRVVIAIRDLARTHPHNAVMKMSPDPFHHRDERRPADTLRWVQALPVSVPDAIGRPGLNITNKDARLPIFCDVYSSRLSFPVFK